MTSYFNQDADWVQVVTSKCKDQPTTRAIECRGRNVFTYSFAGADRAKDGGVWREGAAVHPVLVPPQNLHHVTQRRRKTNTQNQSAFFNMVVQVLITHCQGMILIMHHEPCSFRNSAICHHPPVVFADRMVVGSSFTKWLILFWVKFLMSFFKSYVN